MADHTSFHNIHHRRWALILALPLACFSSTGGGETLTGTSGASTTDASATDASTTDASTTDASTTGTTGVSSTGTTAPTTGASSSEPGPLCGDAVCDRAEVCETCPEDCGACVPADPGLFSIAILPDTQTYVGDYANIFDAQTLWIAENRAAHNIVAVLHEGDIVSEADCPDQWLRAQASMAKLGPELPTLLALGNHDGIDYKENGCDYTGEPDHYIGSVMYDQYFPYVGNGDTFAGSAVNSYITVRAVDGDSPVDLLLINLEFGPSDEVLDWANEVAAAHPDHIGVIVTHDYLGDDDELRGARDCVKSEGNNFPPGCVTEEALPNGVEGTPMPWANQGYEIYDELVALQPNIRYVLNGHVASCEEKVNGVTQKVKPCNHFTAGQKFTVRPDGSKVFQMLANYQVRPPKDGYFRLLTINPTSNWFGVLTINPYSDGPPTYLTDPENYFSVFDAQIRPSGTIPMPPEFGSFTDVPPDHPYLAEIESANFFGLMRGDAETRMFRPSDALSRQAAAQIVWRVVAEDPEADGKCAGTFPDVSSKNPFCWAIEQMAKAGRITVEPGSDFNPGAPISRAQFMAFMFPVAEGETQDCLAPPFPDVPTTHPQCRSISLAADAQVASGDSMGNFGPEEQVKRESAAAAIVRFRAL